MKQPQITIRQLITEIGAWSIQNFDYLDIVGYGILEELGEWAHAQLKFKQKIRKGSKLSVEDFQLKFRADTKDALADCMIFLLNWCFVKEVVLSIDEAVQHIANADKSKQDQLVSIGLILSALSQIFILQETNFSDDPIMRRPYAQRIFNNLAMMCHLNGWNFIKVLSNTWEEVSKRDWRKFPKDGLTE